MATSTRWHPTPRRVATTLVVALLAGGVAMIVAAASTHTSYTAQATVFVDRVSPANGDISTLIADFETASRLPQVDDAVSHEAHVSPTGVRDGLSVSRQGASSTVRVSFQSSSPATASTVVASVTHNALMTLAQQQVDAGTEAVNAAQTNATRSMTALNQLNQSLQADDVEADYARQSQNLINLQNQQAVAPSPGLAAAISSEQDLVANLAAAMPRYLQLKAASDSAQGTLAASEQVLTQASGLMSAAQSSSVLSPPVVSKTSRAALLARVGVATGVVVAVLVIALSALADTAARRRRSGYAGATGDVRGPASPLRDGAGEETEEDTPDDGAAAVVRASR